MEAFKAMYRILRFLEAAMRVEEFPKEQFAGEVFRVSDEYFNSILKMLVDDGYVRGVVFISVLGRPQYFVKLARPEITIKGLEFLQENSLMKKAANIARGVADVAIPERVY